MRYLAPCLFALAAFPAAPSRAADPLYQAMEIVTGTDMRERPRGFAQCLEDVLVKVSGDPRLRHDPRIAEIKAHAADYVVSFNYVDPISGIRPKDDQGTYDRSEDLTVTFAAEKIDALLTSLGAPPWPPPRAVLVPMLTVRARKVPDYKLTASEPLAAEQRAAFERLAAEAGITPRFPSASEFAKWQTAPSPCGPDGTIVVTGTIEWSEAALGWIGTWRACWHDTVHLWAIRGVGYDQAFENIIEGAALLASGRGGPEMLPSH